MANPNITFNSNLEECLKLSEAAAARALNAIGMMAETYAKRSCPVDTGRLRNSITYATPKKYGSYNYKDNDGHGYTDKAGQPQTNAVYIGTNVEYAMAQEYGDGFKHNAGQSAHFLKNAAANHIDEYNKIIEDCMKSVEE